MKAVVIGLCALAIVALVVGGYLLFRPATSAKQTSYATHLEALCADSRKQVEALGRPSDVPINKLFPGIVRIGRTFLVDARRLQPPPEQAAEAKTFLRERGLYYDGLAYAKAFLTTQRNEVAFVRIVDGANANLAMAEAAAKSLGAPVCALRPFE
jgi:hypothetical protein